MRFIGRTHYILMLLAGAIVAASCVPARTGLPSRETMRLIHAGGPGSVQGQVAQRFSELVGEYAKDCVKVEVFPEGTLFNEKEVVSALQLGAVQMIALSLSKFGQLGLSDFDLFDLPFMFPDAEAVHRVTDGRIGRKLLDQLDTHGMVGLGYWDDGFRQIISDRPLDGIEDLSGISLGAPMSNVAAKELRILGVMARRLSPDDTAAALRFGQLNGVEDTAAAIEARGWASLLAGGGYLTVSNRSYQGYAVIVDKTIWRGLPQDCRDQMAHAMRDASRYAAQIARAAHDEAIARLRNRWGLQVHELEPARQLEWLAATTPLYGQFAARFSTGLLTDVYAEVRSQAGDGSDAVSFLQ